MVLLIETVEGRPPIHRTVFNLSNIKGSAQNTGLYTPLLILNSIWEDLSIDFILGLPKIKCGMGSIMVLIDRLSKMEHYSSCKITFDTHHIAQLFFQEVIRLHGIPRSITFNRDVKFISSFCRELLKYLQTQLCLSSTSHPQTDGQAKVVNRSLGSMLRCLAQAHLQ